MVRGYQLINYQIILEFGKYIPEHIFWKALVDELNKSSLELHKSDNTTVSILTKGNELAIFKKFLISMVSANMLINYTLIAKTFKH